MSDAFAMRIEIFVHEQGIPPDEEIDELDPTAEHLILYDGQMAVGTGRIIVVDGITMLGRICVRKAYRGRGLGALIVRELTKRAFERGAEEVRLNAQTAAQGFYEKLGYVSYGEPFNEAHIPHIGMAIPRKRYSVREGDTDDKNYELQGACSDGICAPGAGSGAD